MCVFSCFPVLTDNCTAIESSPVIRFCLHDRDQSTVAPGTSKPSDPLAELSLVELVSVAGP